MEYFGVAFESNYEQVLSSMQQAKGYRSAIKQAVKQNKSTLKPFFGAALTVFVRRMETNKRKPYFVRLGKRGRVLKIE